MHILELSTTPTVCLLGSTALVILSGDKLRHTSFFFPLSLFVSPFRCFCVALSPHISNIFFFFLFLLLPLLLYFVPPFSYERKKEKKN